MPRKMITFAFTVIMIKSNNENTLHENDKKFLVNLTISHHIHGMTIIYLI